MFGMMPESNRNPEASETDPEKLARLLELELMQKRAAWQQSRASRQNLRALSFFFLFLVILGALFAFYYLMSSGELTPRKEQRTDPDVSPAASAHP